jgi:ribonuclease VapC
VASSVLDASALIAFLLQEPGMDVVATRIPGSIISTVNLTEVIARSLQRGMTLDFIDFQIARLPLTIVPFDSNLAKLTATLKSQTQSLGISLADRACLALGMDRNLPVVTGDRDWAKLRLAVQIDFFR